MTTPKPAPGHATYLGRNGYPDDTEQANKILTVGQSYKVKEARQSQSHTSFHLEGIEGSFNSVMFDADMKTIPINSTYSTKYFRV